MTREEYSRNRELYKQIIEEQVIISYTVKGISFTDTNEMSRFDRETIFESIKHIREAEKEAYEKARKEAESKKNQYNFR